MDVRSIEEVMNGLLKLRMMYRKPDSKFRELKILMKIMALEWVLKITDDIMEGL